MERKYLTYDSFINKVEFLLDKYWYDSKEDRWEYMQEAIEQLKIINPKTIIEIGVNRISLTNFSDIIDFKLSCVDETSNGKMYIFDASKVPYSTIKDKQYDCFVALQVLEHLPPNQHLVFKEIKRISKSAIISLPYMWNCPEDPTHHQIDIAKIMEWTNYENPVFIQLKKNRILLVYKF